MQGFLQFATLAVVGLLLDPTATTQKLESLRYSTTSHFFRECTPKQDAIRACLALEELYAENLRKFGEGPLSINTGSQVSSVYRLTEVVPDKRVLPHLATITIMDDGNVRVTAKTLGTDGSLRTTRSFWLTKQQSQSLFEHLHWQDFVKSASDGPFSAEQHGMKDLRWVLEGMHGDTYHVANISDENFDFLFRLNWQLTQMNTWDQILFP